MKSKCTVTDFTAKKRSKKLFLKLCSGEADYKPTVLVGIKLLKSLFETIFESDVSKMQGYVDNVYLYTNIDGFNYLKSLGVVFKDE